jgi:hypothetical protein
MFLYRPDYDMGILPGKAPGETTNVSSKPEKRLHAAPKIDDGKLVPQQLLKPSSPTQKQRRHTTAPPSTDVFSFFEGVLTSLADSPKNSRAKKSRAQSTHEVRRTQGSSSHGRM